MNLKQRLIKKKLDSFCLNKVMFKICLFYKAVKNLGSNQKRNIYKFEACSNNSSKTLFSHFLIK